METEGKDVRHLDMSAEQGYAPGDVALIMPRNRPASVEDFAWILGLDLHAVVERVSLPRAVWCRTPCTLEELISANFDLDGAPRRRFLAALARLAVSPSQRERLEEISTEPGAWEDYVKGGGATIVGVFRDFDSVRPRLEELLRVMPRMRPRSYSSEPCGHMGMCMYEPVVCRRHLHRDLGLGLRVEDLGLGLRVEG